MDYSACNVDKKDPKHECSVVSRLQRGVRTNLLKRTPCHCFAPPLVSVLSCQSTMMVGRRLLVFTMEC